MNNAPMYTVSDLAGSFDVSQQTIRQWSMEFKQYLSARANPGRNRVRAYCEGDVAVLALVAQMKSMGHVYEDVHMALANGQRGEVPDIEKITRQPDALQIRTDKELLLAKQQAETALAHAAELEGRVKHIEEERDRWQERAEEAEAVLHQLEVDLARVQGEMEAVQRDREMLKRQREQIDRLETERNRLTEELMRIYRKLAAVESQHPLGPDKSSLEESAQ
jgi:DNA-binding transcriptional MerR regulator